MTKTVVADVIAAGVATYLLPASYGTAGQALTDVSGSGTPRALSWASAGGGGSGTVTTVSVATALGVSGSVTNPTTTPAITITLGAIQPTSVNSTGNITQTSGGPTVSGFKAGGTYGTGGGSISTSGTVLELQSYFSSTGVMALFCDNSGAFHFFWGSTPATSQQVLAVGSYFNILAPAFSSTLGVAGSGQSNPAFSFDLTLGQELGFYVSAGPIVKVTMARTDIVGWSSTGETVYTGNLILSNVAAAAAAGGVVFNVKTIATLPGAPTAGTVMVISNGQATPAKGGTVSTTGSTTTTVIYTGSGWVYA